MGEIIFKTKQEAYDALGNTLLVAPTWHCPWVHGNCRDDCKHYVPAFVNPLPGKKRGYVLAQGGCRVDLALRAISSMTGE